MTAQALPLIVDSQTLEAALGHDGLVVVDLGSAARYRDGHLPGAVHLDYAALVVNDGPVQGLVPSPRRLGAALAAAGISPETHVVAYDDEGGPKACRLLWTLDLLGHCGMSLLNGGLPAWLSEGRPLDDRRTDGPALADYPAVPDETRCADRAYILPRLHHPDTVLLDARSAAEYSGHDLRAARGGHIPGAINVEWREVVDRRRESRLRPAAELQDMYRQAGITPDKEIVAYCHSHRRSAHSYIVLKALGYTRLRGYPGSWSDWGNAADTPIEC